MTIFAVKIGKNRYKFTGIIQKSYVNFIVSSNYSYIFSITLI